MKRLLILAAAVLVGCGGGISVDQDFAPGTDFSPYRTYAWMPSQGESQVDALTAERIRNAMDTQLQAKGFQPASADPDFYVGYQLLLTDQTDYQTVNDHWGTGWSYGGVYGPMPATTTSRTTSITYTIGTLVIDFFDADQRSLVWRGGAEGRIDETRDPQEREEAVNEVVGQILAQFPPDQGEEN